MKSPAEQKIIQIDITNACTHSCSNCTRFCGHHPKNFFMDFDTFKNAVDSLVDFPGMVGIMGGEPTIHPKFDMLIKYYASKIGQQGKLKNSIEPITDFAQHRIDNLNDTHVKRGLWSSLGKGYYKNYELIQDTFEYQCINDHINPGLHQSLMINRKEMGISDDEWFELRDNCWIQNLWSSAITPKGAFFCEVAGALDMLFDGPGGWKVEKNWWQRTPDEFKEQLHWCELCGAALQTPRRQANEEIDDVGKEFYEQLSKINSKKLKKGNVNLVDIIDKKNTHTASMEWYLPSGDNHQRVSDTNKSLYPHSLTGIVFINDYTSHKSFQKVLTSYDRQLDKVILIQKSYNFIDIKDRKNVVIQDYYGDELLRRNKIILEVIDKECVKDWVVILDPGVSLSSNFKEQISSYILNPGVLYYTKEISSSTEYSYLTSREKSMFLFDDMEMLLFNVRASSLKKVNETSKFIDFWSKEKQIDLFKYFKFPTEEDKLIKQGHKVIQHIISVFETLQTANQRIALFGAGHHTQWLLDILAHSAIDLPKIILSDNPNDEMISGISVVKPTDVSTKDFDIIVISADPGYITNILLERVYEIWKKEKSVINLYSNFKNIKFRKIYNKKAEL